MLRFSVLDWRGQAFICVPSVRDVPHRWRLVHHTSRGALHRLCRWPDPSVGLHGLFFPPVDRAQGHALQDRVDGVPLLFYDQSAAIAGRG